MPKEKEPCKSLSIIILDSVVKAKKKYYPKTLLEERKYEPKKIKMKNLIDDDLEKSLSESLIVKVIMILMVKQSPVMNIMNN